MFHLLQYGTVVPIGLALTLEAIARRTYPEHAPVLLEETKVGSILLFVVTYCRILACVFGKFDSKPLGKWRVVLYALTVCVIRRHALRLEHGKGKIKGIATGVQDSLLSASKARNCVGATGVRPLVEGRLGLLGARDGNSRSRCGQDESKKIGELHGECLRSGIR